MNATQAIKLAESITETVSEFDKNLYKTDVTKHAARYAILLLRDSLLRYSEKEDPQAPMPPDTKFY